MRLGWEWTIGRRWLSCSAQIIPRIIPVTPLNTEQHYSAEGNDDEKDKNTQVQIQPCVLSVTKVEESSALRGNESLAERDPDTDPASHSE